MDEKAKTPSIRFAGFTDAWELRKLGDCFDERQERSSEGELISVTINSGIKKFEELKRHDTSSNDKSHYKRVEVGDIAYNSMRMWQGASGYSPFRGILSPAYTVVIPKDGVSSLFFSYMFKCDGMVHTFQIRSQGITSDTWNLKYPAFSEIGTAVPSLSEQNKIATFLGNLDRHIALQQRKHDKLVNLKKSMLEKMFPQHGADVPEIRFAGFTGAWERRTVGNVTEEINHYATFQSGFPLLTSSRTGLMFQHEYRDNTSTKNQDILFSVVPMGACTYRHMSDDDVFHFNINELVENGLVSREYPVFVSSIGNNLSTVILYLNSSPKFKAFCREQKMGGTRTRLYYKNLCAFQLLLPTEKEQIKIAYFFKCLDTLITLHQRKLTKLQNIKNSCLEKIFV